MRAADMNITAAAYIAHHITVALHLRSSSCVILECIRYGTSIALLT